MKRGRKGDRFLVNGLKFLSNGDFQNAAEEYMKGLKFDPTNAELAYKIAQLYIRIKKHIYAQVFFRLAASLYARQGFYRKAIASYNKVIELSPEDQTATLEIANCYRQLGLPKVAQRYERAIEPGVDNIRDVDFSIGG